MITQTRSRERVQPQRLKLPEKPEMDEKEIDRASPMKNDAHGITQKRPKSHSVGVFLGRSVLCETYLTPIRKCLTPIRKIEEDDISVHLCPGRSGRTFKPSLLSHQPHRAPHSELGQYDI